MHPYSNFKLQLGDTVSFGRLRMLRSHSGAPDNFSKWWFNQLSWLLTARLLDSGIQRLLMIEEMQEMKWPMRFLHVCKNIKNNKKIIANLAISPFNKYTTLLCTRIENLALFPHYIPSGMFSPTHSHCPYLTQVRLSWVCCHMHMYGDVQVQWKSFMQQHHRQHTKHIAYICMTINFT